MTDSEISFLASFHARLERLSLDAEERDYHAGEVRRLMNLRPTVPTATSSAASAGERTGRFIPFEEA